MADLLDTIAEAVGTRLLSNLHESSVMRDRIPRALRTIPPGTYPLEAWRDAVRYILCDYALTPATEREARTLLGQKQKSINILRRKKQT